VGRLVRRTDDLWAGGGTLLAAWSAVALAIALHRGQYLASLVVLVVASLVLTALAIARSGAAGVPLWAGVAAAAITVAISGVAFGPAQYSHGSWLVPSRVCGALAGLAAAGTLVPRRYLDRLTGGLYQRLPAIALLLAVLAAFTRILATPNPDIDVYVFLQDSSRGILHGRDLYHQCWPGSNGLRCAYPYLPITSVLLVPARVLTGDVRFGLLAALVLAVILLRRGLAREAALLPLLLIVFPQAPYSIIQSWTEPLLIVCLVAMVVAVRAGHPGWATVAFAVALASKQHIALLVPLAAWWPAFGWRRTLRAVLLALLAVTPWIIAGPRAFWADVVTLNLHYPVLRDALDLQATLAHLGVYPGFALTGAALLLAYGLVLVRLPRTGAGFAVGGALVLLALDATNKQSFFNHYTLPMALLVVGVTESVRSRAAGGGGPAGWSRWWSRPAPVRAPEVKEVPV
jgi:hypothetical protein